MLLWGFLVISKTLTQLDPILMRLVRNIRLLLIDWSYFYTINFYELKKFNNKKITRFKLYLIITYKT